MAVTLVVVAALLLALAWRAARSTRAVVMVASGEIIACRVVAGDDGPRAVPQRSLGPLEQVIGYQIGTYRWPVQFAVTRWYHFGVTAGGPGVARPPETWDHPRGTPQHYQAPQQPTLIAAG